MMNRYQISTPEGTRDLLFGRHAACARSSSASGSHLRAVATAK